MKKEIAFIIAMVVFGAALGIMLLVILSAIAVPTYFDSLLTIQEKADYEIMLQNFAWVSKYLYLVIAIPLAIGLITFILFFITINRNFNNQLKGKTAKLKATAVAFLCGACFLLLFIFTDNSAISWLTTRPPASDILSLIVYLFSFGLIWFIAGEIGWAGDFSSWKFNCCGKKSKPVFAFLLGAITGALAYGLVYLNKWVFAKYFLLVSEVLDRSGEISWLGFKLLAYGLVFMSGFSFAILAGVIITLVPQQITARQRFFKSIFPLILLAVFISVISVKYNEYDLGKKSFAEAVGIPEKTSEIKTLVLLSPDKELIQEFPMEAKAGYSMISDTFAVSYENLKKVEDYLNSHKNNSVYYYAAIDGLMNGYHRLLNVKKGIASQAKGSEHFWLHRMVLLSRLRNLPVTKENINHLKAFANESKWQISGKSALKISEAFMHFGMKKEAASWASKAKEKGADISGMTFLNEVPLTNGGIKGRIWINGKTPANTKIALFVYSEYLKNINEFTLTNRLIDAVNPDKFGRFIFQNLGKGNYVLAVLTDDKTIPYTTPAEKIKAENSPAIITLDASYPISNIGDLNLVVSK